MNSRPPETLKKQLELARFEKALNYIKQNAGGKKRLNSQELAHINQLMTTNTDIWREQSVEIQLPSGKRETLSVISNPMFVARDILSNAFMKSQDGDLEEAASELYAQLVLQHVFNDGNRRTAVAAVYWLLLGHDIEIPAIGLLELGLGDIRTPQQLKILKGLINHTIALAKSKKT